MEAEAAEVSAALAEETPVEAAPREAGDAAVRAEF